MSSTSSDISTPADEETPRRFPWRIVLFVALVLGALYQVMVAAPPAIHAYRAAQYPEDLAWAGAAAEGAESLLAEDPDELPKLLGELLTPLVRQEDTLAYVRIWDADGTLLCEATALDPDHPRVPGQLSALGFPDAFLAARKRTAAQTVEETIALMLQLIDEQSRISQQIEDGLRAGKATGTHASLYLRQDDNLTLAESLLERQPRLDSAITDMRDTLEYLTRNDESALYQAKLKSLDAETELSQALEILRAKDDFIDSLPRTLTDAAPRPTWAHRLLPWVRGRRVIVPLFTFAVEDGTLANAGAAEVVFYDRLADLGLAIGRHCLPAGGLLLAAILMLIPWRRRRTPAAEDEAIEDDANDR